MGAVYLVGSEMSYVREHMGAEAVYPGLVAAAFIAPFTAFFEVLDELEGDFFEGVLPAGAGVAALADGSDVGGRLFPRLS